MSKIIKVTNLLEDKLNNLLEVYIFLKEENEFLHQKLAELENQMTEKVEQLDEMEKILPIVENCQNY